jgi:hypothetical protein
MRTRLPMQCRYGARQQVSPRADPSPFLIERSPEEEGLLAHEMLQDNVYQLEMSEKPRIRPSA